MSILYNLAMNVDQIYRQVVPEFTQWFALQVDRSCTYLAPGDSAGEMARQMLEVARATNIVLPAIRILSHEESEGMYYEYDGYRTGEIVEPVAREGKVYLVDDFAWNAHKLIDIHDAIKTDFNISAIFYLMIWSGKARRLPDYVKVFRTDRDMAEALNNKWERRLRDL